MPTPTIETHAEVVSRFFQAYQYLIDNKIVSTRVEFCQMLNIDRPNFMKQQKDHSRCIIKLHWLTFMVERFGISAEWLLTGKGKMKTI